MNRFRITLKFLRYFVSRRTTVAMILSLMLASLVLDMASPLLIKRVLDELQTATSSGALGSQAVRNSHFADITFFCILLFIVYMLGQVTAFCKDYLSMVLSSEYVYHLRKRYIERLFSIEYSRVCSRRFGALLTVFESDIGEVCAFCQQLLFGIVLNLFHFIGLTAFVFWLNVRLAFIGTCILGIYLLVVRLSSRRLEIYSRFLRKERVVLYSFIYERLKALLKIRVQDTGEKESERISARYRHYLDRFYKLTRFNLFISRVRESCGVIGNLLILLTGSYLVIMSRITWGTLIAFNNYFSKIYTPAVTLANLKLDFHRTMISFKRLNEILSAPDYEEEDRDLEEIPGIESIEACGLSFSYPGGSDLISGLSFSAKKGEIIAVRGSNGSGKTTLGMLISGFFRDCLENGQLLISGKDIRSLRRKSVRQHTAFILQSPVIFAGTLGEIIDQSPQGKEQALSSVRSAGLEDYFQSLGADFSISEGGKNLSGGERQRLALIEALVSSEERKDVFIFDEVESAQDTESVSILREVFRRLKKAGKIIFVISHREEFSDLFDRTVEL